MHHSLSVIIVYDSQPYKWMETNHELNVYCILNVAHYSEDVSTRPLSDRFVKNNLTFCNKSTKKNNDLPILKTYKTVRFRTFSVVVAGYVVPHWSRV